MGPAQKKIPGQLLSSGARTATCYVLEDKRFKNPLSEVAGWSDKCRDKPNYKCPAVSSS